jgi:hypothetical protein
VRSQSNFDGPSCRRCEAPIAEDVKVCQCGTPTVYMSFQERTVYEVEQYKAWKAQQATA